MSVPRSACEEPGKCIFLLKEQVRALGVDTIDFIPTYVAGSEDEGPLTARSSLSGRKPKAQRGLQLRVLTWILRNEANKSLVINGQKLGRRTCKTKPDRRDIPSQELPSDVSQASHSWIQTRTLTSADDRRTC
jgi:hypothetical protein